MTRESAASGEGTPRSDHHDPPTGNDRQWYTRVTGNHPHPKYGIVNTPGAINLTTLKLLLAPEVFN